MKKFFRKIVSFLKLFLGNLDEWIHEHVQPSIELVQRLKNFLESPVMDIITALIPSQIDDQIRAKLIVALQKSLQLLAVTVDIANEPNIDQQLIKFVQYLQQATPTLKAAIYKQLASEMAKQSAGQTEVKGHSVDLLVQLQYSKMISGLSHNDLPNENN